jgi:hypothetical protein
MSPKPRLGDIITQLPNSEQSYKGKVKTHKCINRENQSTTGKLTSPRTQSGDVLLFYASFSLLLLLFLLLFFHTYLSARFLGDAFIKLYETL